MVPGVETCSSFNNYYELYLIKCICSYTYRCASVPEEHTLWASLQITEVCTLSLKIKCISIFFADSTRCFTFVPQYVVIFSLNNLNRFIR